MHEVLWALQVGLAALFGGTGTRKLVRTRAQLEPSMRWVAGWSDAGVHGVGFAEVVAAVSLVLPAATGVLPLLTPLAAVGLALLMGGATVVNVRSGETARVPITVVLLTVSAFVAWGRLVVAPW